MNENALVWLAIAVFAVLGLYVIPKFMLSRAIAKVIRIFREHSATNARFAKTIDELGLKPRSFIELMLKGRDYKPYAVDLLRKGDIIRVTNDGRVYLSEDKLAMSGLDKTVFIKTLKP